MNPNPNPLRKAFTLVELLVVIAIIGVLLALMLPAIQTARESARQMQCANNLKQIGIAVHTFHESVGGLPPLCIGGSRGNYATFPNTANSLGNDEGWNRASFFALLYPYIEQTGLYNFMSKKAAPNAGGIGSYFGPSWWGNAALTTDMKKQFGSVTLYRCPTRRGGGPLYAENGNGTGTWYSNSPGGPIGDYATVIAFYPSPENPIGAASPGPNVCSWHLYKQEALQISLGCNRGPFRVALINAPGNYSTWTASSGVDFGCWEPRDTFAWIKDGTSNQILLGEKHVPPEYMGRCEPDTVTDYNNYRSDCSYLVSGETWTQIASRHVYKWTTAYGIYRPFDTGYTDHQNGGFGSSHVNVCQFILGDGAVRAFPVTTHTTIITALGTVNDGAVVQMPGI